MAAGIGLSNHLFIGAASDYRWISQVSPLANGSGNRRGERWNQISPALFLLFHSFFVQLEAQILGQYILTNLTPEGAQVMYQRPLGAKVSVGFSVSPYVYLGLFAESVIFRTQSVSESKELHPPLNLWASGLQLVWTPRKHSK